MTDFFDFEFMKIALGGLLGSGLAVLLVSALLLRRNKKVESEVKSGFDQVMKIFESERSWKEKGLAELYGPVYMNLSRTELAFRRWGEKNLYLEAEVVRSANLSVRDLLLTKGHLVQPGLMKHTARLIEHYDAWLEAFNAIRRDGKSEEAPEFVFVGPSGYPFPKDSARAFMATFQELQTELYGTDWASVAADQIPQ